MKKKNKEIKPYVNTSTEVTTAKTKTFSPTSMKLITYSLYRLANTFNVEKYKKINLLDKENWTSAIWEDFSCEFSTKDFCDALGIADGGKQRELIEKAIDKAFDERIKLTNENKTQWYPWFVEALYYHPKNSTLETDIGESENHAISFTFHPGVLAIALNQANGYAHIELQSYGQLKSTYSLKWYQIIKSRYNMKGKWWNSPNQWTTKEMTIPELKELFSIGVDLYVNRTNNLIQKVLKNPIQEINEAGFNFKVEIIYNRKKSKQIENFYLLCTEVVKPTVLVGSNSTEDKKKAREIEEWDLKVHKMKEKYPEKWEELRKKIKAESQMPLFEPFVDQEILSTMIAEGYNVD